MLRLISPKLCYSHSVNSDKAEKYKQDLENGDIFPPIEVLEEDGVFKVLDGAHRLKAHENESFILAFVYSVEDCPKMFLLGSRRYSLTSNTKIF